MYCFPNRNLFLIRNFVLLGRKKPVPSLDLRMERMERMSQSSGEDDEIFSISSGHHHAKLALKH